MDTLHLHARLIVARDKLQEYIDSETRMYRSRTDWAVEAAVALGGLLATLEDSYEPRDEGDQEIGPITDPNIIAEQGRKNR